MELDDEDMDGMDRFKRLSYQPELTGMEEALLRLWMANLDFGSGVMVAAKQLKMRAQEERKAARTAIVRRHQAVYGARSIVQTSHRILTTSVRMTNLEIFWAELWRRPNSTKTCFRRIKVTTKAGTRPSQVVKGAHPDERELLLQHEMQAREIRALWREYTELKRSLDYRIRAALKARAARETGAREGND